MKTTRLFSLLFLFILCFASAQMDDKFYQPSKEMKTLEFSNLESITIPVENETITAYIAKPANKKATQTIVFFHGTSGNVSTYQYITKPLVDNGFQVVMVDFRGYGKSTGTPTHINVAEDGQKFFDILMHREDVKNTRIYFYGASLGSQIASHLAKDNSAKLSGLIIDSGMSSFADIASKFAPQYKDFIEKMLAGVYSAKEDVKNLNGLPTLFIYSKNDKTVPFKQGELLFKNASEPKKLIEFTADHIQAMKEIPAQIVAAIDNMKK